MNFVLLLKILFEKIFALLSKNLHRNSRPPLNHLLPVQKELTIVRFPILRHVLMCAYANHEYLKITQLTLKRSLCC